MIEIKEVLRQWLAGVPKKRIAARLGVDPKTVRRYITRAQQCGLKLDDGVDGLTDDRVCEIVAALKTRPRRAVGDSWRRCEQQRAFIEDQLGKGVRLTTIRRRLKRNGAEIPYSTLHRYASEELGFCRAAPTVRIVDGEPGAELEVDTGWMTKLEPRDGGRVKKFRAFIFTPNVSRYRFVYPIERETTQAAIEAFEAAWDFYGGVFGVAVVDNTKAIVREADPLEPKLIEAFVEYSQARGFVVDPARARKPKDKARVERSVGYVREDCFKGERLETLEDARERARWWCEHEHGIRRHSTTQRMPKEHFEAVEAKHLRPRPSEPYDTPRWSTPKVARDHFAQVAGALYSLPTHLIGHRLRARADSKTVRFFVNGKLVKVHARQPKGGRATDPNDFPTHKRVYAMRDVAFLQRQAEEHGESIGLYAARLLDSELPWTRMRQVYALLSLVRRYGAQAVDDACRTALAVDMLSVKRLRRLVELAAPPRPPEPSAQVVELSRYLRPAQQYALPGLASNSTQDDQDKP